LLTTLGQVFVLKARILSVFPYAFVVPAQQRKLKAIAGK
jgi:hypothetical protein